MTGIEILGSIAAAFTVGAIPVCVSVAALRCLERFSPNR
jgi:hypothetical protein